jgi:diguanylate cyclase (GGDEF)-like protein
VIRNLLDPPDGPTLAAVLKHELERADGLKRGLSLGFIDLDRFTQFNSAHGWDRGNQLLAAIASVLARIDGCPAAGWIGGDAFALVIADGSAVEAVQAMRRTSTVIRDVARTSGICREAIAISAGGITIHRRCTVRAIIRAAHDQLMIAKRAGGDRVEWTARFPPGDSIPGQAPNLSAPAVAQSSATGRSKSSGTELK